MSYLDSRSWSRVSDAIKRRMMEMFVLFAGFHVDGRVAFVSGYSRGSNLVSTEIRVTSREPIETLAIVGVRIKIVEVISCKRGFLAMRIRGAKAERYVSREKSPSDPREMSPDETARAESDGTVGDSR